MPFFVFCFVFLAVAATGRRLISSGRGGEPLLRTRGMIGSRSVYGKAPMRQLHSEPIAVSGSGHTEKRLNSFDDVIHEQETSPHTRFLVGCSSPFMRPHGASRLVLAVSAWSVKTRRAPSRHCRDARRVHGHTTTAMHDSEFTSDSPFPYHFPRFFR